MIPEDLKYTTDHEWVKLEGNIAVVGITDHAQEALGDITFVDLPPAGRKLAQHKELATVESVKAASDVFAPLAGTVAEVNASLAKTPEVINRDPYGAGWICRLKDVDTAGLANLMSAAEYEAILPKE